MLSDDFSDDVVLRSVFDVLVTGSMADVDWEPEVEERIEEDGVIDPEPILSFR